MDFTALLDLQVNKRPFSIFSLFCLLDRIEKFNLPMFYRGITLKNFTPVVTELGITCLRLSCVVGHSGNKDGLIICAK